MCVGRSLIAALIAAVVVAAAPAGAQSVQYRSATGVEYRAQLDTGAIARADSALAADPRNVERIIQLGIAQSGARQFREAIQTFTRGLAIAPNNAMLYRWRGHRYLSVREFNRAIDDLTHGFGLDSTNYGILYHLGIVRYARGDFGGAADAFARAQRRAPEAGEQAGSTDWLWMSLMRAGRVAEAQAMLNRHPDSLPATNAYARRLKLYRGEISPDSVFTPADTGDIQVATLSYGVGNWHLVRGDTLRARAWFERSIRSGGWPAFAFILSEVELRGAANTDVPDWERQAQNVTIIRDDWGIPHIYGKTDADAVFGLMYAQAEDDFNRVEMNYINAMGRLAEAEGESAIYRDLRMKLFINADSMKAKYEASPEWLKKLMNACADGLNYYLYKHPEVKPKVIKRFDPWMALTFSEGSIGGDIESVSVPHLGAFYGNPPGIQAPAEGSSPAAEPTGSNGIAIAPSNTAARHALLLINPHTSFFFRAEVQVVSDEGLNAYGAVTWGQFFVYQGFNERAGWMHTSSGADNIDAYLETVVKKGDDYYYRYGTEERPLVATKITVPYKTDTGMAQKEFTVYRTHHGPIVRRVADKWVSVKLMQEPVKALIQSYSRTKAKNYQAFRETMELHTNSSNNTIFADADGNIAYFHANFVPRRDTRFDWSKPVDGSNPATEWKDLHSVEASPHVLNPASGWLYNTNNWPYSAAGANSPKKSDYPSYMESGGENPRGIHAIRVLQNKKDFTLASLIDAAYDSHLTAFAELIPPLLKSYDQTPAANPLKAKLAEQIELLRDWDYRWSTTSVPTSLAVFWGDEIQRRVAATATRARMSAYEYAITRATAEERLQALSVASDKLAADFGSWRTPWGDINRFQRLTGDIVQPFNDAAPSIPVGFTSARWGSLASFGARLYEGTKKWYGTSGNSFVAVVEFGDSVRAKAVTAGGESGNPMSPHFNDQAMRYSKGDLRDVYFYRPQVEGHAKRQYHPGS